MTLTRLLFCAVLVFFIAGTSGVSSFAQRPGPQFWRRLSCEPIEPRTKLEAFDERYGTVVVKGFTQVNSIDVRGVRVDAVELRDTARATRVSGIVIALSGGNERPQENRAFIDYEEIDGLLAGIDAVSRVNESMTKLASFEGKYRTLGDFEVGVFRQTRSGNAVSLTTGVCEQVRVTMSLDELVKVKAMIAEAKAKLDEAK
ncbi:MAG TPA: hypothetical protein VFH15_13675 [Pyrinomonadaceae bacterium]|nr:hypothetical protein [Pyrinomonadaceae bacterium]